MNRQTPVAAAGAAPITTPGVPGFFEWVQRRQPYLLTRAVQKKLSKIPTGAGVAGLGLTDPQPLLSTVSVNTSLVSSPTVTSSGGGLTDILSTLLMGAGQVILTKQQLDAQKQVLNLQLDRAKAGLPPLDLDPTTYGLPGPTVKLGVDAETKTLLLIAGGVAAAGFVAWLIFGSGGSRRAARRR